MKKNNNLFYFIIASVVLFVVTLFIILYRLKNTENKIPEIIFNKFIQYIEAKKIQSVQMSGTRAYIEMFDRSIYYTVVPKVSYIVDLLVHHKIPVKLSDNSVLVTGIGINNESTSIALIKAIANIISSIISIIFFLPVFLSMNRGQTGNEHELTDMKQLTFKEVIGMRREKYELQEVIELINKGYKQTLKCSVPKGVLLSGPPGNGKTYLAKACAGECNGQFLFAAGSEFINTYVGVGPAKVRSLFQKAKNYSGFTVIYIDEIDALGSRDKHSRGEGGSTEYQATINQLLTEIDGFASKRQILVILSTNQPDSLDKALVRSGRIDRKISVENPRLLDRELLLEYLLKDTEVDFGVNINLIAKTTIGFSRADITTFINETKLYALREDTEVLKPQHFELAKDRMLLGIEKDKHMSSRKELYNTAYHEIGHAFFICKYEDVLSPLYKVTILPRGQSLGVTIREGKESVSMTKRELEANIMTALAGRACEVIFFGNNNVTSGCSSDLHYAKSLIEQYIIYGMDENYGVGFVNSSSYQERQSNIISQHSDSLLNHFNKRVFNIILENKELISQCAEQLFAKETLTGRELRDLIKKVHYLPVQYLTSNSVLFN